MDSDDEFLTLPELAARIKFSRADYLQHDFF